MLSNAVNSNCSCPANVASATFSLMEIHAIRLQNLRTLINQYGSQAELAAASGKAEAQFSQYVTNRRKMGEKFARSLEIGLELPADWMDESHSKQTAIPIREPRSASYGAQAWPFSNIPYKRIAVLTRKEIKALELAMESALVIIESQHGPPKKRSHA